MTNVLVTGAGGQAGIALIRTLVERGEHVVAVDPDPLAAGLRLAARHAVVSPPANAHHFVGEIAAIVKTHSVDLIVPTDAQEMLVLAGREHLLGAAVWLPDRRSVVACVDKWRFWKIAEHALVPTVPTALGEDEVAAIVEQIPGPWIVKPRFGRGSHDVYAVDDPAELAWACRRIAEPIVQTRLAVGNSRSTCSPITTGLAAPACRRLETTSRHQHQRQTFCDERLTRIAGTGRRDLQSPRRREPPGLRDRRRPGRGDRGQPAFLGRALTLAGRGRRSRRRVRAGRAG